MTLTEVLITSTVLVVLLGMVFGSLTLIENVSSNVSAQYQEFDQALPAMAPFHSLLAAEVEPGPTSNGQPTGTPTPGFSSIGNFSVTFYANIGTAYGNVISCPSAGSCAGTTAGPAMVQALELDSTGQTATSQTSCTTANPCSLQVRLFLPAMEPNNPGVSTCPGVSTDPNATACVYPSNYRLMANVLGVVNSPKDLGINPADKPIFTYTIFDPYLNQSITLTSAGVANQTITGLLSLGYTNDTATLAAADCAAPTNTPPPILAPPVLPVAISCPMDAIQSVGVDLQIAKPGSNANSTVDNSMIVYRYAQSPGSSTAPYQYSATVG
jgi:hypothetical protein